MTTNSDPHRTTSQAAEDETKEVVDKAQNAAREVTDTAQEEARRVTDEAADQFTSLASSAQDEFFAQASTQQKRLAEQSRTVTDDIHRISRGERPESELVNRFTGMLAQRAESFTAQLENKEPSELLGDLRRFASRRPGTFLAIAAGVGLVAGRLTSGLTDNEDDGDTAGSPTDEKRVPAVRPTTDPAPTTSPTPSPAASAPLVPDDAVTTDGNKHHFDNDRAAPVDDFLSGGTAIDPEERR